MISGAFFDPETHYTLTLTPPTGDSQRLSLDIRPEGEFILNVTLNTPGQWQIDVQGADIFTTRMVQVVPATTAEPDDAVAIPAEEDAPEPAAAPPPTTAEDTPDDRGTADDPDENDVDIDVDIIDEPEVVTDDIDDADEADVPLPDENEQPDTFLREGNAVIALMDNRLIWELPLASGGLTTDPVLLDEQLFVGHGNSLLAIRTADGIIEQRWPLSGQVGELQDSGDTLVINITLADGLTETLHWRAGDIQETVLFDIDPAVFGFLRQEADSGTISAAQDPTNPYLHLQLGREAPDSVSARQHFSDALASAQTFYDLAALSRELLVLGETELANTAFDSALQDFAARGYDPRLLRNPELHEHYHFPLRPMQEALREGDLALAGFWAEWLQYFVSPDTPEVSEALTSYAALLRQSGQPEAANRWRDLARPASGSSVRGALDTLALRLAEPGWYEVLALLIAVMLLHAVLTIKYLPAQNVNLRRRIDMRRNTSPLGRLLIMRYYNLAEKLVVVLMLLVTLAIVVLATWNNQATSIPVSLQGGTFASRAAQHTLSVLPVRGDYGALVSGYAAQARGDTAEAITRYQAAGNLAGARNNLAILLNDPDLFAEALRLAPLPEARHNLGQDETGFRFHQRYLPDAPVSYVPTEQDIHLAMIGSWQATFGRLFSQPWQALSDLRPQGLPMVLWLIVVGALALYTLYCALWLLVPRMRWVSQTPRPLLYYVAAFFIPGSAMADELWGFFVLLPWTFFSASFLGRFFSTGTVSTGVSYIWDGYILGFIYLLNTVALIFDYRKQKEALKRLRRDNPELAREFGLNVPPADKAKPHA